MRSSRYWILAILLVGVLGLGACTAALPGAFSLVDNFVLSRHASAAVAAAAPASQLPAERQSAKALVAGDFEGRLSEIYDSASPSVVDVQVVAQSAAMMGNMPRFMQPGNPNQNNQDAPNMPYAQGEGSGFVWDNQGYIVTNNHVVDSATKVSVTFADGTTVPATVVGTDPESDLAVIKVDPKAVKLQPITVGDSSQVKVGQFVVAIGSPFGLEGSMTFGIVSGLGRSLPTRGSSALSSQGASYTIPDIIQTDAPVNPGNSGGVLLDLDGNLVGVPSAITSSGGTSAGVGFAIPSTIVKQVVPELIQNGKFVHPWIGISGATLTSEMAQAMSLSQTQRGALVINVTQGSPAEKAGLNGSTKQVQINGANAQVGGDVITAIDGQTVNRFEDLVTYLARSGKVGQTVKLTILRDGKSQTVSLTLAARPTAAAANQGNVQPQQRGNRGGQGQSQQPTPTPQPRSDSGTTPQTGQGTAWLGVAGIDLTADVAKAMNLTDGQTGALIQQVVSGSPADKAGLQAGSEDYQSGGRNIKIGGDVIVSANNAKVGSMQDLVKIVQGMQSGDKLDLTVLRGGKETKVTVELAVRPTN